MNGKRCAIRLELSERGPFYASSSLNIGVRHDGARIYGSHSEAKRELKKWLPLWPDAKIVDEEDL